MADKYEIESKRDTVSGTLTEIATAGLYEAPKEYTIRNTETDERFTTSAYSEKGVGRNIAAGKIHRID